MGSYLGNHWLEPCHPSLAPEVSVSLQPGRKVEWGVGRPQGSPKLPWSCCVSEPSFVLPPPSHGLCWPESPEYTPSSLARPFSQAKVLYEPEEWHLCVRHSASISLFLSSPVAQRWLHSWCPEGGLCLLAWARVIGSGMGMRLKQDSLAQIWKPWHYGWMTWMVVDFSWDFWVWTGGARGC